MKDIPVFTGAHGVATLVLRQIPWSGTAYVLVRAIWDDAKGFLEECLGFCRACGAQKVYATNGMEELPLPHAYDMCTFSMEKTALPKGETLEAELLTGENQKDFLSVYDTCFRTLPNAAAYEEKTLHTMIQEQTAFLYRRCGVPAAIAQISKQGLETIGVLPAFRGLGYPLALTVLPMVPNLTLHLKTISVNHSALELYRRLGFKPAGTESRWWCLLGGSL